MKVVLADDESRVRSALRLLLEQERDWEVCSEARQADELLICLAEGCCDIVLLDWELPGLAIDEVLCHMRRLCPHTWVVALSSRLEAQSAALSAGVDAFVSKAEAPERLLATLHGIHGERDNAGSFE